MEKEEWIERKNQEELEGQVSVRSHGDTARYTIDETGLDDIFQILETRGRRMD